MLVGRSGHTYSSWQQLLIHMKWWSTFDWL